MLQLGLPGANLLFLGREAGAKVLDDAVGMAGVHLRLLFVLDRRSELRPVVDDLKAVLTDVGVLGSFGARSSTAMTSLSSRSRTRSSLSLLAREFARQA
ncbi:hypothetical protein BRC99_01630 [Halobacteriales archaeon QS_7_69_60]|nr:MAG: hypothetical protein BRC99_01630 [Halobacteriales archaeon QS_7_69_60]